MVFKISVFGAVLTLLLLVSASQATSQDWWCCYPDDCDQLFHPPCYRRCQLTRTVWCGPPGEPPQEIEVTCNGVSKNWTIYQDPDHEGCVEEGELITVCSARFTGDCNIPEGWFCLGTGGTFENKEPC